MDSNFEKHSEKSLEKTMKKFENEIEKRKNKVNQSDFKFFNVFLKSILRQNISKIDEFILKIS